MYRARFILGGPCEELPPEGAALMEADARTPAGRP